MYAAAPLATCVFAQILWANSHALAFLWDVPPYAIPNGAPHVHRR
jgi:hypothetical protein